MSNYYGKIKNKRFIQNQGPYNRPGPSHSRIEYSDISGSHGNLQVKGSQSQNQPEFIRPKHNLSGSCSSYNDIDGTILNKKSNNKGRKNLMSRMANSVTGIFGKSWWPEWLKGWEGSQEMLDDDLLPADSSPQVVNEAESHPEGESFIFSPSPGPSNRSPFKLIYPEEGEVTANAECSNRIDTFPRGSQGSERPPDIPSISGERPPFLLCDVDQPLISSTPANSNLIIPRRMKLDSRDYTGDPSHGLSPCIHMGQSTNGPLDGIEEEELLIEDEYSEDTIVSKRKRLREGPGDVENQSLYTSALEESTTRQNKRPRFASDSISTTMNDTSLTQADTSLNDSSYSIFYPGKVMYGGAANYRRSKLQQTRSPVPCKVPLRSSPAPSSTSSDGGLSQAAQRILASLDSLSTPLTEAKRLQVNSKDHIGKSLAQSRASLDSSRGNSMMTHLYKHRPRLRAETGPPATRLLTPNKVKLKENLTRSLGLNKGPTTSTSTCQETSNFNSSALESRLNPPLPLSDSLESDRPNLPTRARATFVRSNSPEDKSKMGRLKSFSCMSEEEMLPEPQIPSIGLHLSSMPKIVFSSSVSPSIPFSNVLKTNTASALVASVNSTYSANLTPISTMSSLKPQSSAINFKSSIVSSTPLSVKSPQVNFKFSSPVAVDVGKVHRNVNEEGCGTFAFSPPLQEVKSTTATASDTGGGGESDLMKKLVGWAKNKESSTSEEPKTQTTTASWGASFLPAKGSWECDVCMVRNKSSDATCISCTTPKPAPKGLAGSTQSKHELTSATNVDINSNKPLPFTQTFQGFGSKFMPNEGEWNCESCLLRNKADINKCASCETLKKGGTISTEVVKPIGFDSKFLTSKDEWECKTCMVRNKVEVIQCVSCSTYKKGNFDAKFLPSKDEWECEMCCIRNKSDIVKCISCGTAKKGAPIETAVSDSGDSSFKFGIEKTSSSSSTIPFGGFQFGSTNSKSTSDSSQTKGFSFGVDNKASSFKFGIGNSEDATQNTSKPIKFGIDSVPPVSKKIDPVSSPNVSVPNKIMNNAAEGLVDLKKKLDTSSEEVQVKSKPFSFGSLEKNSNDESKATNSLFTSGNAGPVSSNVTTPISSPTSFKAPTTFSFGGLKSGSPSSGNEAKPLKSNETTSLPTFSQAKPTEEKKDAVSKAAFTFGKSEDAPKPLESSAKSSAPIFSFGQVKDMKMGKIEEEKKSLTQDEVPAIKSVFSFGQSAVNSNPSVSTFGSIDVSSAKTSVAAGTTQNEVKAPAFVFGQEKAKSMFVFGQSQKEAENGKTFSFGQKDSSKESSSFSFGQKETSAKPQDSSKEKNMLFSFGDKQPVGLTFGQKDTSAKQQDSSKENKSLFSFGGKQQANVGFSFGQKETTEKQQDSSKENNALFSFGGAQQPNVGLSFGQKDATKKPGVFSFGNTSTTNKEAPLIFGSKTETKKDSTLFGQDTPAAAGAFAPSPFGAQVPAFSATNSTTTAPSIFSLGTKAPEKPAEKSFNFGQATPSFNFGAAAPTNGQTPFQFGQAAQQPSQNVPPPSFGSSMPSNPFSCTPTAASQNRVVRKAVRRKK